MKRSLLLGTVLLAASAPALAQDEPPDDGDALSDIEVPTLVLDSGDGDTGEGGAEDIDLANIVQSAARAVTTVQEAPAIVTVITSEEIEDRHVQTLPELIDVVPGYMRVGFVHSQFPHPLARGQVQAAQFLHDGVSMFDPYVNTAALNQVQPMELIKRVELITGPGGVLWGSNSLLGIVNVITKDAEDVDGVEVGLRGSHGPGNREYLHGYVMAGKTDLLDDEDNKLLIHGSFKTYSGPGLTMAQHIFSAPLPQPNSALLYGPLTTGDPERTFMFNAFAKLTMGKTQLRVMVPFMERHLPLAFPGTVQREHLPEDDRPECNEGPNADPTDGCLDQGRTSRDNQFDTFDRYAVLEYRTRMAGGKAGLSAKLYATQFVRQFDPVAVLSPIENLLEGGLGFKFDGTSYRAGTAIDGDVEAGKKGRILYGLEAFREWAPNTVDRSRQGAGTQAEFVAPYLLQRLPVPCPRTRVMDEASGEWTVGIVEGCPLTFAFPSSRSVLGGYLAPQYRPTKKLILDAGARVQIAPESLGENSYGLTPTFGASAVYNFIPNWHMKLNFAQGFRPPVFNNLNSNGEAVQIKGDPDLLVEKTNAGQAEVNARILKNKRRIRELNFRLDYSYTQVENLVQVVGARYANTANRDIHSVEFLGKLYIEGGHRIELGYTWLQILTADQGAFLPMPEHWFNLTGVYNIVDEKLHASTNLKVVGAHEDINRLVEHRGLHYCTATEINDMACQAGDVVNENDPTGASPFVRSNPSELVLDRLPPSAELAIGLSYMPNEKLTISAEVFNTLNGRFYQPDAFFNYEPRLEFLPNPYEDFRAYLGAAYNY